MVSRIPPVCPGLASRAWYPLFGMRLIPSPRSRPSLHSDHPTKSYSKIPQTVLFICVQNLQKILVVACGIFPYPASPSVFLSLTQAGDLDGPLWESTPMMTRLVCSICVYTRVSVWVPAVVRGGHPIAWGWSYSWL